MWIWYLVVAWQPYCESLVLCFKCSLYALGELRALRNSQARAKEPLRAKQARVPLHVLCNPCLRAKQPKEFLLVLSEGGRVYTFTVNHLAKVKSVINLKPTNKN